MEDPKRMFRRELISLLGKYVIVETIKKEEFKGVLLGIDTDTLSVCLGDVEVNGSKAPRLFIMGHDISKIYSTEPPLDLEALAEEIKKVFPNMVILDKDARIIKVMHNIIVSEAGVKGSGPVYQRVKKIYENFVKSRQSSKE